MHICFSMGYQEHLYQNTVSQSFKLKVQVHYAFKLVYLRNRSYTCKISTIAFPWNNCCVLLQILMSVSSCA